MVTSQDSGPVHSAVAETEVRIGTHLVLRQWTKPYINAEHFAEYIWIVFRPHLANARKNLALVDEEVVLLMDNCGSHIAQKGIDLLTRARCRVVTFTPHTTNIFQVLDLTLFGVLKRQRRYQIPCQTEHRIINFMLKVYRGFRSTTINTNIWGAFRWISPLYVTIDGVQGVLFNKIIMIRNESFWELWQIDYLLENLSVQWRNAKFGWINKPG
jgi:hypothetical protein